MHHTPSYVPTTRHQRLLRLTAAALRSAGAALDALAAQLAAARRPRERDVEFSTLEVDGRVFGAVYEDGQLVALLPEVGRL